MPLDPTTTGGPTPADAQRDGAPAPAGGLRWRRRPLLRAVGAAGGSLLAPLTSSPARAGHETDPCGVTIDFNRAHVARVFAVAAAGVTSLTVYYVDRDGTAQTQQGIDPTTNAEYGEVPLRVRYDAEADKTTIQSTGPNTAVRRVVAYGPDCRSAMTNPLDSAAGDNEEPLADFTWSPAVGVAHEPVTFTSAATDPDGDLIHYGWDFDGDGEEDATGADVTHTFTSAGDHAVTHTVIDDFDATGSATETVSVVPWGHTAKLVAGDGDAGDGFGGSVALDGDTAIIGADGDEDPNGFGAGAVYVFTRERGRWVEQAKLVAADGDDHDGFGGSVALDGDTVLIGAVGDEDPNERRAGSAYVFTRTDGGWRQQAKLVAADGDDFDFFGGAVAVSGDTAIIGASGDEGPDSDRVGSAYVFGRDGDSWSQHQKLTASDGDFNDLFGSSVAIDGDTAIIGAAFDEDPNGGEAGSAYVFTRERGRWAEQAKLVAADGDESDTFGGAVALDADTAVVGAEKHLQGSFGVDAGAAYVFTRAGDRWVQQQKLSADDDDTDDAFGVSVALDGDTVVVGANFDEDPIGEEAGSAYVFTREGTSWAQQRKLVAADGDAGDWFGVSVATDGGTAVVGALFDEDPNGRKAGSAYVFRE